MSTRNLDIGELRSRVRGAVIEPSDEGYDLARRIFYGGFDSRPAVVVRVAGATDVAVVLEMVRGTGLDLAVRSGGHNPAGYSTSDGGVVIDVRDLTDLDLDANARTAWAGTGLTAAQFSDAVGEHGLAVGFGDTGSVGIGGLTLGGGVGFLSRKHGLTIDSLLAVELVTADGRVLVVDDESHPDLFWALRGGGGNFGVATRFKYSLADVDRVVGGLIVVPATSAAVARFVDESETAPEELTAIVNVMTCPPMPGVPEELVGKTVIMGLVMWCGDIEEGHRVMDRFRSVGEPVIDTLGEMAYPDIFMPEDEGYQPLAIGLNGFSDGIDSNGIATLLEAIDASDASLSVVQIRALGGAIARVPGEATAYAHRDRSLMLNVAAFYESEEDRPRREAWVRDLFKTLTHGDDSVYVGFLADEGADRIRSAYPGDTWDRLRRVKREYDPDNTFRLNQNIPPRGMTVWAPARPLSALGGTNQDRTSCLP